MQQAKEESKYDPLDLLDGEPSQEDEEIEFSIAASFTL